MRQTKDCETCRGAKVVFAVDRDFHDPETVVSKERKCSNCCGVGTVPLMPPVGETVIYRRPLHPVEQRGLDAGTETPETLLGVARWFPLRVLHADRVVGDGECYVRVTGYVDQPPAYRTKSDEVRLIEVEGAEVYSIIVPRLKYLREVRGPSDDPGCWNWRKEPS